MNGDQFIDNLKHCATLAATHEWNVFWNANTQTIRVNTSGLSVIEQKNTITISKHLGDATRSMTLCYYAAAVHAPPSTHNRSISPPTAAFVRFPPPFVRAHHPPRIQGYRETQHAHFRYHHRSFSSG